MTLRTQIHDAIDDIATPSPALAGRVKAFVVADDETRRRLRARPRSPWATRFRGTLVLVAAALVLTIVAGLFIAGRLWRNENLPSQTISQPELKSLESRALSFPIVAPGAPCPVTPVTLNDMWGLVIGSGPVFLVDREIDESGEWGYWVGLGFTSAGRTPGVVLIRARDLRADVQVAFANYPLAPTQVKAVGRVLGDARVVNHKVQLRTEAAFNDPALPAPHNPELFVLFGVQQGSSGCIGFQVDGPGFSENFVATAAVPGL